MPMAFNDRPTYKRKKPELRSPDERFRTLDDIQRELSDTSDGMKTAETENNVDGGQFRSYEKKKKKVRPNLSRKNAFGKPGRRPSEDPENPYVPARKAFDQLVIFLAKRDHSKKEIQIKLTDYGYNEQQINEALEMALSYKYLADEEILSGKVAEMLHSKKKSYLFIRHYLNEKGLTPPEIDSEKEVEKCRRIIEQKLGHLAPFAPEEKQKVQRWLMTRGFDSASIRKVLNEKS